MVPVKPVKGKLSILNSNRATADHGTSKNAVGPRNFKVYAENDKLKVRIRDSVVAESRRKSVPVISGVSQVKATDTKPNIKEGLKILEKTKGKRESSVKINIGRRALADISNVRGDTSSTELHDGSKPMKAKNQSIIYSQRSSMGAGIRIASSSKSCKELMGNPRSSVSQATGDHHTLKKRVVKKDLNISSNNLRAKVLGHVSAKTSGRMSERDLLPPKRTSLPVLKRVNIVQTSEKKKDHNENSGKIRNKYGFPVNHKVGTKVLTQVSNSGSHHWKNRVSDGFIIKALGGQGKVDSVALSRNLVKPSVKAKVRVSDIQKISKSMKVGPAISSKRKEEVVASSSSAHTVSAVPSEQLAQEDPSDLNKLGPTVSDVIATRKSGRRKSYTSLLMARSKLLKEHAEVTKQDFLPNIYDDFNHLEVVEYVDEIYRYYWVMEAQFQPSKDYMEIQTEITPQMRGILVNWLIEVHLKFDLMQETLYLTVTLLDRYLSLVSIKKNEMQLVGLTALLLASKYEDYWHPRVKDLIGISAESYTRDQMLGMEKAILRALKFRLNSPTPYVFMLRFLKAAQSDTKFEHLAFYLIELCVVEYEALKFKPSLLCASAIYLARCTLFMTPAWTPLLLKHACYDESQIRGCAETILKFQKAGRTGMLKVAYEKFMRPDYSRVAAIKPLDRLPF